MSVIDRAEILNRFPEVIWDRCAGDEDNLAAYGWIARDDGRADFVLLRFENGGIGFTTSSARYSSEFWARLYDDGADHTACIPVEEMFPDVAHVRRAGAHNGGRP